MAKWVESGWYRLVYGDTYGEKDSDKNNTFRYPNWEALDEGLKGLLAWLLKANGKSAGSHH